MGYLNLVDAFIYRDPVFKAKLDALAENDAYLKDNGWNTNTATVFYQASVPTGWTQAVTQNDKMLRVVNTVGTGTGGSQATSATILLTHTAHTISTAGTHTHDAANHTHILDNGASNGASPVTTISVCNLGGYLTQYAGSIGTLRPAMRNKLLATTLVTTGSGGSHNHGGNTTGSRLTDINLAYCDVIVGSKNTSSGYTDLTTYFTTGLKIDYNPFVTLAQNDEYNRLRLMPFGSIMLFYQSVAPTGWTKISTTNDRFLRIVSGTGGGTGGTHTASTTITLSHTHTTDNGGVSGAHTHSIPTHSHDLSFGGNSASNDPDTPENDRYVLADGNGILRAAGISGPASSQTAYETSTNTDGSGTTDSGGNHFHTITNAGTNFVFSYLDAIQCSKDSTGAPQAYEDVTTGVFGWKKLVSKQRLNKLSKNDEYLKYHTTPSGSAAFFYMTAAPLTWTKLTAQHDKAIRIVSGSSGGTAGGGVQLLSAALNLAHTHTINPSGHTHNVGSHTHTLASSTVTCNSIQAANGFGPTTDNAVVTMRSNSGSTNTLKNSTQGGQGETDLNSHDHGTTGSALTNITMAYVDVIYCQKD